MTTGEYRPFDPASLPLPEETPSTDGLIPDEVDNLFDDRQMEDFHGLFYIGALEKEFEWFGHKIVIRTLRPHELLLVAQLIKPWAGTIAEQRAYITAMVSLAVQTVDGQHLPLPLGDDGSETWARHRFNFVKARWFDITIDRCYSHYLELESRVREVLEQMEKASGQGESSTPGSNENSEPPSGGDFFRD